MDQSSGSKRPAGVRGRGEVVDVVGADKQKVITDDAVLVQAQKKRTGTLVNAHSANQAHVRPISDSGAIIRGGWYCAEGGRTR